MTSYPAQDNDRITVTRGSVGSSLSNQNPIDPNSIVVSTSSTTGGSSFSNENFSIDPNAYAYPYFHSIQSTPLLYHLIITHFAPYTKTPIQTIDASTEIVTPQINNAGSTDRYRTNILHSSSAENKNLARRRSFTGRRIQSRCQKHPEETKWVDSCGETALFRFCQLIRFRNKATCTQCTQQKQSDTTPMPIPMDNNEELIFFVLQSFLENDSSALATLNKWGEIALHQFVAHCGFFPCSNDNDNPSHYKQNVSLQNHNHRRLSKMFLEIMLRACPKSVYQKNYQRALPLHVACSLSQLNGNKPFSSSDSTIAIDELLLPKNFYYEEEHSNIIERLIEYYPTGVTAIDMHGCTPLYRAVESIHCSPEVVILLLKNMEMVFAHKQTNFLFEYHLVADCMVEADSASILGGCTKFLLHEAILGSKKKQGPAARKYTMMENSSENDIIMSPLEALWKTLFVRRYHNSQGDNEMNCASTLADFIESELESSSKFDNRQHKFHASKDLAERLGCIWQKIMILICCAYQGTMSSDACESNGQHSKDILPIHAAISCSSPRCVLDMLTNLYPNDVLRLDKNGNTPLMLSMISPSFDEQWKIQQNNSCDDVDNHSTLKQILRINPETVMIPNARNRLPLHVAIEKKIQWEEGLEQMFNYYSEASCIRDPKSNLLPFILAGMSCAYSSTLESLNNSYLILRANPAVLKELV